MNWIVENWGALLAGAGAAIALLHVIAKLTPNKVDDAIVDRIEAVEKSIVGMFPASDATPVDPKADTVLIKK